MSEWLVVGLMLFAAFGWSVAIVCAIKWWHAEQDLHWEKERHRMTSEELRDARRLRRRRRLSSFLPRDN